MHRLSSTLERYERQIKIIGAEGQQKLMSAKVMVAGVGGLGCTAAILLTAAGVGKILLVDKEKVDLSNLNRQILYTPNDIGKYKALIAAKVLKQLNPSVEVEGIVAEINDENVDDLIRKVDLVIDGMDNYEGRFLLNKACVKYGKTFIHGAIHGLMGQLLTVIPKKGPCLQCVIPALPPSTEAIPVIAATPATIASLEVMEAIKIITGVGEPAIGRLIVFDGEKMKFYEIRVAKNPNCPVCQGQ